LRMEEEIEEKAIALESLPIVEEQVAEEKAVEEEQVAAFPSAEEPRGRKRPLLYECPRFVGCEQEFDLLRKIKKLNRDVDVALTRRRLFIGQELRQPTEVDRVLRLHIYHTYSQDENNPALYNWTLKILGHILDPQTREPVTSKTEKNTYNLAKLAYQVSVVCEPKEKIINAKNRCDWIRKENDPENAIDPNMDGFQITRQSSGPCSALVYVFLDSSKKYFKVSDQLLSITGARPSAQYSTLDSILSAIYVYAKSNKLISSQNPGMIRCDQKLKQIFAAEYVPISQIEELVKPDMKNSHPLMFNHKIRFEGTSKENCDCIELLVKVPLHTGLAAASEVMPGMNESVEENSSSAQLQAIEEKIHETYAEIDKKKQEYNFFKAYAKSPVDTVDVTISAAERLLKTLAEYGYDWKRKQLPEHYNDPWVKRAVRRYLSQLNNSN